MHVDVQTLSEVPAMQKAEVTRNQKRELLVCLVC